MPKKKGETENVRVVVRLRPLSQAELAVDQGEVVRVGAAVLGEHVDAAPLAVAAAAAADAARVAVAVRHDRRHALRRAQPGLEEEVGVELGPAEQPEHEVPRAERDDEEAAGDGGGVAVEGHSRRPQER